MAQFRVSATGSGQVDVEAPNWMVALGEGIVQLGQLQSPDRLVCERMMNGTVMVRDARSGQGYVVQPLGDCGADEPDDVRGAGLDGEDVPDFDSDIVPPELVRDTLAAIPRAMAEAALALAVNAGVRLTHARGGAALLLESAGLRFRYVCGEHAERLRGMQIPLGAGVAGFSVSTHTALVVHNAYADPRFYRNVDHHTGHRTLNLLCVPMVAAGQTWGCLELVDSDAGFSDEALGDMERLANAVAERLAQLQAP